MSRRLGVLGLALAAASGFAGACSSVLNIGGSSALVRSATKRREVEPHRSTAQFSDSGYLKHPPGTVAQSKRAAIKAKNRAKHRAHMKGRA